MSCKLALFNPEDQLCLLGALCARGSSGVLVGKGQAELSVVVFVVSVVGVVVADVG